MSGLCMLLGVCLEQASRVLFPSFVVLLKRSVRRIYFRIVIEGGSCRAFLDGEARRGLLD